MINQEELIDGEIKRFLEGHTDTFHWITRQNMELLCETSLLVGFEFFSDKIKHIINSKKVDSSIDEGVVEMEERPYELPPKSLLEERYRLDSQASYLSQFESTSNEHVHLALNDKFNEALKASKDEYEIVEVFTIAYLKGEFDIVPNEDSFQIDGFILSMLKLIKAVELRRAGLRDRSDTLIEDLLDKENSLTVPEVILTLNDKIPWEEYPYID